MFDPKGKKILVIGMARSGQSAARFLANRGAQVTGTDLKSEDLLGSGLTELKQLSVELVMGGYPHIKPGDYDLVIVSPGVPGNIEPILVAEEFKIPIWSELELAGRFIREPIIAVTGTNGKTTTTSLLEHTFKQAGYEVVVAGNIGVPLIREVEKRLDNSSSKADYWIVEVSSFQLERIETFRPQIGIFLNLTPDHLDRHGTIEAYGELKARMFTNQNSNDYAVYNLEDQMVLKSMEVVSSQRCGFSCQRIPKRGIGVQNKHIIYNFHGNNELLCSTEEIMMPGSHNLENALAAASTALIAGVDKRDVAKSLATFPGVPHRIEEIRILDGVRYINDSKGTNPEAVIKAMEAYDNPIVLIAGGRNKGSDFGQLMQKVLKQVKALILLGEAAPLLRQQAMSVGFDKIWDVSSLAEATRLAHSIARSGDVVLLSPGCTSWDMFRDYEERGNFFRKAVEEL